MPNRKHSLAKLLASRKNGARCADARTTHGLTAQSTLLPGESGDRFHHLAHAFTDYFQPQHEAELYLVEQLVSSAWRLRRIQAFETSLLREKAVPQPGKSVQLTAAEAWLASNPVLALRYEAQRHRAFRHWFSLLCEAKTTRIGGDLAPSSPDQENQSPTGDDPEITEGPEPQNPAHESGDQLS